MRESAFETLVASFIELETTEEAQVSDSPGRRAGAWLQAVLGLSLTCVGLGYGDAVWAGRYLHRVDTRSAEDMLAWDRRSARGWLRRNLSSLPSDLRPLAQAKGEPGQRLDDALWRQVANSINWADVGPWGPGAPTTVDRLRRLQGLFVLTRLIAEEASPHSAFSFMIGSNQALDGQSPLTFVATNTYRRYEEALAAAEYYLAIAE